MSHEISFKNGHAEAIYTGKREDVWHRLGKYIGNRAITVEEAREVIGIQVEKVPVRFTCPVANGTDTVEKVSEKAFLTVRMDTGAELASVGPDYTVVQHEDAILTPILPLLDAGFATLDVAGLLRDGLRGWTMLKWNLERFDPIVRDVYRDEIQPFSLCFSAHGEGNANSYSHTTIRGVCHNTVSMILRSGGLIKVVHRKNAAVRQVEAAERTFKHVIAAHKDLAEAYQKLKAVTLDMALWKELVQKVAIPNPSEQPDWDKDSPRAEIVMERFKTKANRVYKLWTSGAGHSGDKSAWEAYNGLVESLDHDTDLWKGRNEENRALSLTDGPLAKVRQAAFDSLLKYANDKVASRV